MLYIAAFTHSMQAVSEVVHDVLEACSHLVRLSLQVPQYIGAQRDHRLNRGLIENRSCFTSQDIIYVYIDISIHIYMHCIYIV